jgi:hypothetical protein
MTINDRKDVLNCLRAYCGFGKAYHPLKTDKRSTHNIFHMCKLRQCDQLVGLIYDKSQLYFILLSKSCILFFNSSKKK